MKVYYPTFFVDIDSKCESQIILKHFESTELNSTLDTFVDKSPPGKYYCDVDKSDYHDDVDTFTCKDVNGTFTACREDVMFLCHGHLQYCHNYEKWRILQHQNCCRDLKT